MRSPEVARFLTIDWQGASLGGDSSYGSATLPFESLASVETGFFSDEPTYPRPVLVYVAPPGLDTTKQEALEKILFGDDDLALASRIFRFKRLAVSELSDSQRAEYAPKLPAFIAMNGDGQVTLKASGTLPAKSLLAFLGKAYSAQYKGALPTQLDGVRKNLDQTEKVEDRLFAAQTRLRERSEKATERPSAKDSADLAKLTREVEAIELEKAALETARAKLIAPPRVAGSRITD